MDKFKQFIAILNTVDANIWGMCIIAMSVVPLILSGLLYLHGKGSDAVMLLSGVGTMTSGAFALMRGHSTPPASAPEPGPAPAAAAAAAQDDVIQP